jgi:uncharacterized membrane protein YcaP (DUF421 family)
MRIDWGQVFAPEHTVEVMVRGSLMYLALFVLLRVLARREVGGLAPTNLLVLVLIADAAQNAMAGTYTSLTDGVVLVATIIAWSLLIDWASFQFTWVARLVRPGSLTLVRQGRMIRRNMRRELITEAELRSQLRKHDVQDLAEVDTVRMEYDGRLSVVRRD